MGANHARIVAAHPEADLACVVDVDDQRARRLAAEVGAEASGELAAALRCDAAVVAVPNELHLPVATSLLEAGLPLLVEKPLATEPTDVAAIVAASRQADVALMCGFVERFSPAVQTAIGLVEEAPLHFVALRHSPPTPRIATSVVYDLLIHDIDLAFQFTGEDAGWTVSSSRWAPPGTAVDEIADCTLTFSNGMLATLSSSRASQRKVRSIVVATPNQLFELDLLRQDLTVYRHVHHEQVVGARTAYRAETVVDIPFVRHAGEPLALQFSYFVDLVTGGTDPEVERRRLLPAHEVAARVQEA